jgi:hypothetical protein
MFKIQNKAGLAQWFFRFGNSYFIHLNLSFDFAQDGEPVEPFRVPTCPPMPFGLFDYKRGNNG